MTRIKICGITNIDDALAAVDAGADTIGLNFYAQSPRAVSVAKALTIRQQLPETLEVFGVFVNADPSEIMEIVRDIKLDAIQLHGDESNVVVKQLACVASVFKALGVGPDFSGATLEEYPDASGFLFDAADREPGQYGGTGRLADWGMAQQAVRRHRFFLAGGLNAENVAAAILQVRPYGVDVASGVEAAPGTKDHTQLRKFIREARRADQELNTPAEKMRAT